MRKYSAMLTHHKHDTAELINTIGELQLLSSIRRYSHVRALKVYLLRLSMKSLCLGKFILPNFYEEKIVLFCYVPKVLLSLYKPSTPEASTVGFYVVFYQSSFQTLIRNGKTPVIGISSSNVFIFHMVEKLT